MITLIQTEPKYPNTKTANENNDTRYYKLQAPTKPRTSCVQTNKLAHMQFLVSDPPG